MDITIKFDRKEIEDLLRTRLQRQFPGHTWAITAGTYGDSWKAESMKPEPAPEPTPIIQTTMVPLATNAASCNGNQVAGMVPDIDF